MSTSLDLFGLGPQRDTYPCPLGGQWKIFGSQPAYMSHQRRSYQVIDLSNMECQQTLHLGWRNRWTSAPGWRNATNSSSVLPPYRPNARLAVNHTNVCSEGWVWDHCCGCVCDEQKDKRKLWKYKSLEERHMYVCTEEVILSWISSRHMIMGTRARSNGSWCRRCFFCI